MASNSTRVEIYDLNLPSTTSDALEASKTEHEMTFSQAIRIHRKAVVWSAVVSLATIMDGYDLQIMTAFYGYPSFQKKYGVQLDDGSYSIPASWQLGLNLASNFGLIVGGFFNGWLVEHVGPRRMMIYSYIALAGFIFISFFAPRIEVLLVGSLFCGIPWGVFATIAPLYAAETERNLKIGSSYIDCFRGTNLRRTEIASVSWGGQVLTGFAIQNYITYFFTLAGLASSNAFKLSLGVFGAALLCTVFSWLLQSRFGRREIYIIGLCVMTPIMLLVALLDFTAPSSARNWGQCSMIVVWYGIFGLSVGPIPFAIATEVPASRLRTKTIAISRNTYYVLSTINVVATPYLINPTAGNLKGKAAFPAAGFSLMLLFWAWFRLPETKGRTFEELDVMFEQKISARIFGSIVLNADELERSHGTTVEQSKC
ncbi:putative maltose permease [Neofusicoccum parvum]|nr:putative maltose permease [Neofusicoccum parvum]